MLVMSGTQKVQGEPPEVQRSTSVTAWATRDPISKRKGLTAVLENLGFLHCCFCLWTITRRTPFIVLNKPACSSSALWVQSCVVTSYCALTFRISSDLIGFLCYICSFRCDLKKKRYSQHTSILPLCAFSSWNVLLCHYPVLFQCLICMK